MKQNEKKMIMLLLIILIVTIVIYFIAQNGKNKVSTPNTNTSINTNNNTTIQQNKIEEYQETIENEPRQSRHVRNDQPEVSARRENRLSQAETG